MPNFCAVYKCGHNSARDCDYNYFRILKIISNQSDDTKLLSAERRQQWLKNIRHRAQPRTQALSSGKERPWSELVTCHPESGW